MAMFTRSAGSSKATGKASRRNFGQIALAQSFQPSRSFAGVLEDLEAAE